MFRVAAEVYKSEMHILWVSQDCTGFDVYYPKCKAEKKMYISFVDDSHCHSLVSHDPSHGNFGIFVNILNILDAFGGNHISYHEIHITDYSEKLYNRCMEIGILLLVKGIDVCELRFFDEKYADFSMKIHQFFDKKMRQFIEDNYTGFLRGHADVLQRIF
jgi:hypothetical protein